MDTIKVSARAMQSLNYLRKHLFDNPVENPTNIPKIAPNGANVENIRQVANIIGVDRKIARYYVLQDPNAPIELKQEAKEAMVPGIYLAADDGFEPVLHQAYAILNKPIDQLSKSVRLVRTANGVNRFKQKQGTIIVNDGEDPLDALTALPNDVPGYEKITDKNGQIYYVGNENGAWVARDPKTNTVLYSSATEEGTYSWLNEHAGGSVNKEPTKKPTRTQQVLNNPSSPKRGLIKDELGLDINLTAEEAVAANISLTDEELELYLRLKKRGLDHQEALKLSMRKQLDTRKPSKKK